MLGIIAACFFLILTLPLLDFVLVFQMSEAREGAVIQQMLETGEVILPLRHGETIPSKPVLFHWIAFLFAKARGVFDEFGLRLPSAVSGALTTLVLVSIIAEFAGTMSGVLAFLIFSTSYGIIRMSSDGRVDMVFTFFVSASILVWLGEALKAVRLSGRSLNGTLLSTIPGKTYLTVGILAGLAVLAKGPLGLVLPVLVVGAIAFFYGGFRGLWAVTRIGWFASLVIAVPWYIAATLKGSESFLWRQIFFENINRFVGGEGITQKPVWFYLAHFWLHGAPWSFVFGGFLLLLIAGALLSKRIRALPASVLPEVPVERLAVVSGLIWTISCVVFFSLSSGKRRAYLLPTLPGVTLTLAVGLPYLAAEWHRSSLLQKVFNPQIQRFFFWVWLGTMSLFLIFVGGAYLGAWFISEPTSRLTTYLVSLPKAISRGPLAVVSYFVVLNALVVLLFRRAKSRERPEYLLYAATCALLLVFVVIVNVLQGTKGVTHSYDQVSKNVATLVPSEKVVRVVKYLLDESFDTIIFYYPGKLTVHNPDLPFERDEYYLVRRDWYDAQPEEFRASVSTLFEGGRMSDPRDKERLLLRLND